VSAFGGGYSRIKIPAIWQEFRNKYGFPNLRGQFTKSHRALGVLETTMSSFPCSKCRKECLAEFVGTYMLVVIGPASVIVTSLVPSLGSAEALGIIALTFGGVVGFLILVFGEHSGAVFNPAITLGAILGRVLRSRYLAPYLFFQLSGGILAGATLREVFLVDGKHAALGSTKLANGVNPLLGISLEAAGTFFLTFAALLASVQIKERRYQALLVGGTLFVLILLIGPLTGAGFNPARSLGPSLASGYLQNLYVYILGPILGALIAGLIFRWKRRNDGERRSKRLNIVCLC
jgi:MIP family channel proteins